MQWRVQMTSALMIIKENYSRAGLQQKRNKITSGASQDIGQLNSIPNLETSDAQSSYHFRFSNNFRKQSRVSSSWIFGTDYQSKTVSSKLNNGLKPIRAITSFKQSGHNTQTGRVLTSAKLPARLTPVTCFRALATEHYPRIWHWLLGFLRISHRLLFSRACTESTFPRLAAAISFPRFSSVRVPAHLTSVTCFPALSVPCSSL